MAERLIGYDPDHPLPVQSPSSIVSETAVLLHLYLSDQFKDESPALDYLAGPTTIFLRNVNRGFLLSQALTLTRTSKTDAAVLLREQDDLKTDDSDVTSPRTRALESFNFSLTIFSQMPDLADSEKYSSLVPIKIAVRPPRNSFEMLDRIRELRKFIEGVKTQNIRPKNIGQTIGPDSLFRIMGFFQVGKDMPTKEPPIKEDVMRLLKEAGLSYHDFPFH